jgi:tetratricopeptide (TPR) repeat protein
MEWRRYEMTTGRSIMIGGVFAVALFVLGAPLRSLGDGGGGGSDARDTRGTGAPSKAEDPNYAAAVKEIKAQKFSAAIPLLEAVVAKDDKNADAYNWLAYAIRRTGDPGRSIPIYHKALALDAKHRGAHEYIGEAYLALDDVAKAKEHLVALDKLCRLSCEQYRDLKKAVEAYEKSGGKTKP